MKAIATQHMSIPDMSDETDYVSLDRQVLAVLIEHPNKKVSVNAGIIWSDPVEFGPNVRRVMCAGRTLTYHKALYFFPTLREADYQCA